MRCNGSGEGSCGHINSSNCASTNCGARPRSTPAAYQPAHFSCWWLLFAQVTGELFTPHGISLGRWTTTWVPKPRPLLFRLVSSMLLGPWRMLGLLEDTTRVELSLFDSFQNPSAPAGGWGSLPGYRRFVRRQQQLMQSWDEYGSDDDLNSNSNIKMTGRQGLGEEDEEGSGPVPGPRALWLRVSLSGRSYEAGPPRVYNAKAKLDVDRGEAQTSL